MSLTSWGALCTATLMLCAPAHATALTCDELAGQTFGNARILETQAISGSVPITSMYGGNATLEGPACRVLGESRPTPDSSVRLEIWLPPPGGWNGRYQAVGNGGNAGTPFYPAMAHALNGGYAVSGHDTGHIGLETEIGLGWMGESADERGISAGSWGYPVGFFRDYVHGDPDWEVTAFDLSRDLPAARRGLIGFSVAAEDPDLSRFAERGGKLLQYHGWHDMGIPARNSIRYYEDVAQTMGGLGAIQPFYRLFLGTGMGHCGGGNGPNAVGGAFGLPAPVRDAGHDVMETLAAWIEKGRAPETIVATRYGPDGRVVAQRPWCAHPKVPVWDGVGDRTDADSYSCRHAEAHRTKAGDEPTPGWRTDEDD